MAKVLVIDDEPDLVRLISKVLVGRGHVVATARDGATALTRVVLEPHDVIIVDSDLPKIDGPEVCRRIKSDSSTRHIPVVMMTQGHIDLRDVCTATGPDAFVVRPFVREVLANAVERVLARR